MTYVVGLNSFIMSAGNKSWDLGTGEEVMRGVFGGSVDNGAHLYHLRML